jgi:hypothetical protein
MSCGYHLVIPAGFLVGVSLPVLVLMHVEDNLLLQSMVQIYLNIQPSYMINIKLSITIMIQSTKYTQQLCLMSWSMGLRLTE